ncbi:MAG: hypothetical protein ACRDI2_15360 [Chloroflexota bacterium]
MLAASLAMVAILTGRAIALAQGAQGSGTITLTTEPEAGAIVPDEVESPTKFIIEARGPQGPLRNAYIDFEVTAPSFGPVASSDIPAIEGTTLFKSRFGAPEGRLEFEYVVPIRGAYTVKVQAIPAPGATFQPITREFELNVNERPSEVVYFWSLIAGLAVVGVGAGFVLGYFNRATRAAA